MIIKATSVYGNRANSHNSSVLTYPSLAATLYSSQLLFRDTFSRLNYPDRNHAGSFCLVGCVSYTQLNNDFQLHHLLEYKSQNST